MSDNIPNIPPVPAETAENETAELNQLKEEMRRFRKALESQKIISERLLRNVIGQRASKIMFFVKIEAFVLLPFVALAFLFIRMIIGIPWTFYFTTIALIGASTFSDYIINRPLDPVNSSLIDILARLIRQKRQRIWQIIISIPIIVLWVAWYVFLISYADGGPGSAGAAVIGAIIGGIIGVVIFLKQQKSINDSIREINMILGDENIVDE